MQLTLEDDGGAGRIGVSDAGNVAVNRDEVKQLVIQLDAPTAEERDAGVRQAHPLLPGDLPGPSRS